MCINDASIRLFSIAAYPALSVAGLEPIPSYHGVKTAMHPNAQPRAATWPDFTQEHFCHWSKPCTATVNIQSGLVLMAPPLKCFLDKQHAMSHREHNAETPHFEPRSESGAKHWTPESRFRLRQSRRRLERWWWWWWWWWQSFGGSSVVRQQCLQYWPHDAPLD